MARMCDVDRNIQEALDLFKRILNCERIYHQ